MTTTLSKGGVRTAFQAIRTITKTRTPSTFTSHKTTRDRFQKYVELLGVKAPDANLGDTSLFGYNIPHRAYKVEDDHHIVTGDGSSKKGQHHPLAAAIVVSWKGSVICGHGCVDTSTHHDPLRAETLALLLATLVHENGSFTYRTDHDLVAKRFASITAMAESNFDDAKDGDIWREIYRRLPTTYIEIERIPRGPLAAEDTGLKAAHDLAQRAHEITPGTFCNIPLNNPIPQATLHTRIPWDTSAPTAQLSQDEAPTDEEITWAPSRVALAGERSSAPP